MHRGFGVGELNEDTRTLINDTGLCRHVYVYETFFKEVSCRKYPEENASPYTG